MVSRLVAAALAIAGLAALAGGSEALAADARLTVTGVGEVRAEPDMATLRIAVENRAREADVAVEENSETVGLILLQLQDAGLEGDALRTAGFTIRPLYENAKYSSGSRAPRITGFSVTNSVVARIDELRRVGPLLDTLVASGVTQIDSLAFGLKDDADETAKARSAAIADARTAAETYAAAAGLTLGPILEIRDAASMSAPGPQGGVMALMEARSVPIEPGSVSVGARITVVWALEDVGDGD